MLVGLTVFTGQYWADRRKASKEQLAAYIVNLAWNGLSRLEAKPTLRFEGKHPTGKPPVRSADKPGKDSGAGGHDASDDEKRPTGDDSGPAEPEAAHGEVSKPVQASES
jgi:hypothetical protein